MAVLQKSDLSKTANLFTADDEMINHSAIERFGGGDETARRAAVRIARSRVPARMVVGKHDPRTAVLGGIADDLPEREFRAAFVALVTRKVQAARLVVEMRHPQAFPRQIAVGEAAGEKFLRGGETCELESMFGTLITHRRNLRRARECATRTVSELTPKRMNPVRA